jgi:polyferredoxin
MAALILIYFSGALLLGLLFKGSPFCSHLCPLGQFSLVASLLSPFEVSVRDLAVCDECGGKECIKGSK